MYAVMCGPGPVRQGPHEVNKYTRLCGAREGHRGLPRGELQDLNQPGSPGVPGIFGGPSFPGGATGHKPSREPWSPWSPWRALPGRSSRTYSNQ